jgi:hypothetical protein
VFVAPGNLASLVPPFDSPCYLSREHFTRHRCKKVPEPAVEEEKEGEGEAAAEEWRHPNGALRCSLSSFSRGGIIIVFVFFLLLLHLESIHSSSCKRRRWQWLKKVFGLQGFTGCRNHWRRELLLLEV